MEAAPAWAAIDWQAPWLADYAALGQPAARHIQAGASVPDALNALIDRGAAADPGVRFVPQQALAPGRAYESFIHASGCVPTRDNLHDFFNGLIWLHWPQAKRRWNGWQAQALAEQAAAQQPPGRRGPLRDAITLLDENGALLCAPPALAQALAARQWQQAFITLRPLWQQARLWLLGHALLEKLVYPRKPMVAHVLPWDTAIENIACADAWLASAWTAQALAAKPFNPVPVLGVPGWAQGHQDPCFYDDPLVFRPARSA